ncbi:hypothetical protein LTR08_002976 [Meristemomyces frigidus]|nr:hypothetical protein LTR08_002976 [Meristemomyces frigidus]
MLALVPLLAGLAYALPQAATGCVTVTTEVIIPTTTATYLSTYVTTVQATTAEDLGTFTLVERESSTKTLTTLTSTATVCAGTGTYTDQPKSTVYTTSLSAPAAYSTSTLAGPSPYRYVRRQDACTVTSTFTTTYGQTETFAPAGVTSTFTDYTAFSQATVTTTSYGGTTYAIATAAAATTTAACAGSANTTVVTQDVRCQPSNLISESNGYGLEYASDVPASGASYATTAGDGSECCQQCADTANCAASSWDSRTGVCKLEFPVDSNSGELNCGEGLLAYYDAGPNSPMAPGTGLFVAALCGTVEFGSAAPDDGT